MSDPGRNQVVEWRALGLIAAAALVLTWRDGLSPNLFDVSTARVILYVVGLLAFVVAVCIATLVLLPPRFRERVRWTSREPADLFVAAVVAFVAGIVLLAALDMWAALDTLDNESPLPDILE